MKALSVVLVIVLTATCGQKGQLDVPPDKTANNTIIKESKIYLVSNCEISIPVAEYRRCLQNQ